MGRATARAHEPQAGPESARQESIREPAPPQTTPFATATHHDLFAEASIIRCDVCDTPLSSANSEEQGTGVYIWARGAEVRREEVPLCPTCSDAIFASAVALIDLDDEE